MGGAPYQGRVIAEALSDRPDFEVFYLARRCSNDVDADPYKVVKIGSTAGIRRRAVLFDAPNLWRTLREIGPDVIYQRMRQSYTAVAAAYAKCYGRRFVFHVAHDYDVMLGRTRRHLSFNTPFDVLEGMLGTYGMVRADAIIAQTERQAGLLSENFGRRATAVIPNLHPAPEASELVPKSPDIFQVAWVANFKLFKRPELFVRLAEEHRSDRSMRFVMVGRPGDSGTFKALHERIQQLPNLDYLGELPLERVNELMAQSHVLVNTSHLEGFSNTFIQAWLRNTVVVSMNADIDGALSQQGLGYLAGGFDELRDRLMLLLRNRPELEETARKARSYAVAHYTTRSIESFVDLLRPSQGISSR